MTDRAAPRPIVDLSVQLVSGMTVFPGDPSVEIGPALTIERDGVNVLALHIGSQTGTHLDAPSHVLAHGPRLDELPLERFIGPAVVADVRDAGPGEPISWEQLAPVHGALHPGAVLLLHTGWSVYFDDLARYRAHPWLSPDAATRIVAAGVLTVGLDALNIDATPDDLDRIRFDTHQVILGAGGVIVENLTGLEAVSSLREPVVSVLPLNLPGADGAPVRAVAFERTAFGGA
jgi:kynurenine formamidase